MTNNLQNQIGTPVQNNPTSHSPLPPSSNAGTFHTENLELGAYLLTRGHRLIGTIPTGRLVVFEFEHSAGTDVANFFSGAVPLTPITLFEHHRTLRSLIATMRNTRTQSTGGVA
jgi:hypothetical protein